MSQNAYTNLIINGLAPDSFLVSGFTGTDEISAPYCFTINLISQKSDITIDSVVGQGATLYILRDSNYIPYSGVVSGFSFVEKTTDFCRYCLELVPRLWTLSLNTRSKVYQQLTPLETVEQVLRDAGLSSYYKTSCNKTYNKEDFILQYNETDLNFIRRLMQDSGIWFLFEEKPVNAASWDRIGKEILIITDDPVSFMDIEQPNQLNYRSRSGLNQTVDTLDKESIHTISFKKQMVSANINLKNYTYRTPEVALDAVKPVDGGKNGEINDFGGRGRDVDSLMSIAQIRANQLTTSHSAVIGRGVCRGFKAGYKFSLVDAPHPDISDQLLIQKVTHEGTQSTNADVIKDKGDFSYHNSFVAIATGGLKNFMPSHELIYPKIHGVVSAKIESIGGEYAHIDDKGRYKIRLPFDTADAANAEASKYVRLSQAYSGTNYGIHFPSHEGTEMLIGYINGDPDKPVGLGTVPNANTISPVTSNNKHQSIIRTAGNNQIILDDMDKKQKIHINTNAKHLMTFDDENKVIVIKTTDDNKVVLDDKNKVVNINAAENLISISYGDDGNKINISSRDGHNVCLDDENKVIELKTAGGNIITMDDENEIMTLTDDEDSNSVVLDKSEGVSISTQNNLQIRADGDVEIEGANISLRGEGNVEVESDADVSVDGMNVAVNGQMNVDIEAGLNATVKGSVNAEFSGSAKADIKGGIVNIN